MEKAFSVLYWWRASNNLELPVDFRRRNLDIWWSPESEYEMCSAETQEIASILVDYRAGKSIDGRTLNYYPLLDRIVEWMDETYG